mmetsp:Transcript_28649/g.46506  ORF Transcript_28649/g.46506 Transcript_28649/m.46506 type:complete len:101 (-) Transcript_28649:303-605(-)
MSQENVPCALEAAKSLLEQMSPNFLDSHCMLSTPPLADLLVAAFSAVFLQRYMQQQCCLFCICGIPLPLSYLSTYTCYRIKHMCHSQRMTISLNLLLTLM